LEVSGLQEIQAAIGQLTKPELEELADWLIDHIEDQLEFTDDFQTAIADGKRDLAQGKGRYRKIINDEKS
jgi:hypothetical protein